MVSTLGWFIGMSAAILNTSSLFPQIIKGYRTKRLKDLSWGWLGIAGVATALWILYGVIVSDPVILIANIITGILYAVLVFQKYTY